MANSMSHDTVQSSVHAHALLDKARSLCCAGAQQGGGSDAVPQRDDHGRAAAPAFLSPVSGALEAQEGEKLITLLICTAITPSPIPCVLCQLGLLTFFI